MDSYQPTDTEQAEILKAKAEWLTKRKASYAVGYFGLTLVFTRVLMDFFYQLYGYSFPLIHKGVSVFAKNVLGYSTAEGILLADRFVNSFALNESVGMLITFLSYFLPFLLLSKTVFRLSFDKSFPTKGEKFRGLVFVFGLGQFFAMCASILSTEIVAVFFPFFADQPVMPPPTFDTGADFVLYFFSICVFTPFLEEFIYRGVMVTALKPYGKAFAVFSSAVLFGLSHAGIGGFAYATAFGFILGAVFLRTGNLFHTVLIHGLNNAFMFVYTALLPELTDEVLAYQFNLLGSALLGVFGIFGLIHLLHQNKPSAEQAAETEEVYEVPVTRFFCFGTVLFIGLFIYNLIISVLPNLIG